MNNILCFGDNLDILREHIAGESVDAIYLDPPFKSKRDYNLLVLLNAGVTTWIHDGESDAAG